MTWAATDAGGNSSTCTSRVTVLDRSPPTIICPADATVPANASCSYTGAIPQPAVSDNCTAPENIALSNDAPSVFAPGTTAVTWTATDAAGNFSTCTARVIIADTTPPVIACPQTITKDCAGPGGTAVDFSVLSSDDCDPAPEVSCSKASGTLFPEGITTVECLAQDASGNTSTCSFEVRVSACGGRQVPGDCNQDGKVDLSDGVCLLGFLFVGDRERLPCGDGTTDHAANKLLMDWNHSEGIDLSDAVALLGWLFQGADPHFLGEECQPMIGCPDACVPR